MDHRRVELAPHPDDFPHHLASHFLREGQAKSLHGLQEGRAGVYKPVHDGHGSGHDKVQRVGVLIVVLAGDEGDLRIGDLPAQGTLAQGIRQGLGHLSLVAVENVVVFDDAVVSNPAAPRSRLYQEPQHRPAGLGHGVGHKAFPYRGRRLLINNRGIGEIDPQAKTGDHQRFENLQLDEPGDANEQISLLRHPRHSKKRVFRAKLFHRCYKSGIVLLLIGEHPHV